MSGQSPPDPTEHAALPDDLGPLIASCIPQLHAFVRLQFGPRLREHEASDDIVQSVIAEVVGDRHRFTHGGESGFRSWLFLVARRKIADRHAYWQAAKRDPAREARAGGLDPHRAEELLGPYASVCTPSREASAREEVARIEAAFDSLAPHYRDVIVEARVLQRDRREMAEERGITPAALRQLLARAMAALVDLLADDDESTDGGRG